MSRDDFAPDEGIQETSDPFDHTDLATTRERDQLAQLTLDYLDVLNGGQDALPTLDDLTDDFRQRVLDTWSTIDRIMVNEPLPPLDQDPVAIALSAVPTVDLDPTAIREARQIQGIRPSDVAHALQKRGWATTTAEVFAWERRPHPVAPALLADLATTLRAGSDTLAHNGPRSEAHVGALGRDDATRTFQDVLYSDELNEIVDQWAQLFDVEPATARHNLQRRVASLAYRGAQTLSTHQWKAILQVLLAAERARLRQPEPPVDRG
jgi:hypothetical protein